MMTDDMALRESVLDGYSDGEELERLIWTGATMAEIKTEPDQILREPQTSKKTPPYFPFWTRDFVHSCRTDKLTPAEVGALTMALCQQWEIQGPLPSDPAKFAAFSGWDIRVARRLVARLVELKKLDASADGIQSTRMQSEIEKYVAKVRAAELRETRKATLRQTSHELPSNFPEKSERSYAEVSKKNNEINDDVSREAALPESDSEPDNKDNPPTPLAGGVIGEVVFDGNRVEKPKAIEVRREGETALEIYNKAAEHFGFARCHSFTDARRKRLAKRIVDIGGVEQFRSALNALAMTDPFNDFLLGRAKPRPGEQPFRLDFDRLLQSEGNLGDVLARLRDLSATSGDPALDADRRSLWLTWSREEWRAQIERYAKQVWPVNLIGPVPGWKNCMVPADLIAELKLTERFDQNGFQRRSWVEESEHDRQLKLLREQRERERRDKERLDAIMYGGR